MEQSEFIRKYESGEIKVHIDRAEAVKLVKSGELNSGYRHVLIFFEWIWGLSLLTFIPAFFYSWWLGLILLFFVLFIPDARRATSEQQVIEFLLKDYRFYCFHINDDFIEVEEICN